ncbi:hypothetical protein SSX86_023670 [Deinandra increscens subsp. villosa]|uniref:Mitochondrial import inner membrane translocase subunit TIM50 n=1 Tax=Deinandra increscens subsp. villosa TaxID=3103831 RepID=A0AAP0GSD1_9ASTR
MATEDSKIKITKDENAQTSDHYRISVKKDNKNVAAASEEETVIDLAVSVDRLTILPPKKKLLVLPITGFLVHRAFIHRKRTIPKNRRPDFCYGHFMIYKRPYCEEFLKFCFERFEVGIWSSATDYNIGGVLTNVMGDFQSKLLFTWDQNQCTPTDFKHLDNDDKQIFLKELDRILKKKDLFPYAEYSASNTLLITDPVKALLNPPNTSISPSNYNPENLTDNLLGPNGELWMFLDKLAEAEDVQTYVEKHPIGDPAITPSHADWEFYSKIISAYGKNN